VPSPPEIHIESLAYQGAGVGHLPDGRVLFVDGTAPGDCVRVEIVENHERFARARVSELIVSSPQRIDPFCPYHASCGGCPWQQVAYDEQCVWKHRIVLESLRRIGAVSNPEAFVEKTAKAGKHWWYRNKVEFGVQLIERNARLGFQARRGAGFVPVDSCRLLPYSFLDASRRIAGALTYACRELLPDLHRVTLRVSEQTNDVELSLWTNPCLLSRSHVARVLNEAVRTTSMTRVIVDGAPDERKVKQVEVLTGRGFWREMFDGRCLKFSAPSFFQVNSAEAVTLLETVLEFLDLARIQTLDHVVDLYAGAGTFTLPLAARYRQVSAVESYGPCIKDLRRNLEGHNLKARIVGGDVARELAGLGSFQAAVIDPPRAGLSSKACAALIGARPRCIVYVSCDPATLARDIRVFTNGGYHLKTIRPIDLFPQTFHVESVALLLNEKS